jgi:hypothetical protein
MSRHEIRSLYLRHIAGELTRNELITTIAHRREISVPDAEQLLNCLTHPNAIICACFEPS